MNRIPIFLFFLCASVYFLFAEGVPWPEARNQMTIARNIISTHRLGSAEPLDPCCEVQGRDGFFYDIHSLANVLLMVPIAALEPLLTSIFGDQTVLLINFLGAITGVFVTALGVLGLYFILQTLELSEPICLLTALVYGFCTMIVPYSGRNYEENLDLLFIIWSIFFAFRFNNAKLPRHAVFSWALAGLALNSREFAILYIIPLAGFMTYLLRHGYRSVLYCFLIGFIPPLLMWAYYNNIRGGNLLLSPIILDAFNGQSEGIRPDGNPLRGAMSLLFAPGGSVFIYSPVLILSLFGIKYFWNKKKAEFCFVMSAIVFLFIGNAINRNVFGFAGWGPRYALPIVPLLAVLLGFFLEKKKFIWGKSHKGVLVLIGISLFLQISASLINWKARLEYLMAEGRGINGLYWNPRYSMWFDSVQVFSINLWNHFFRWIKYVSLPGFYSKMSPMSEKATFHLFYTWWTRLPYYEVNPAWIIIYLFFSGVIIFLCAFKIYYFFTNDSTSDKLAG